MKWVDNLLAGFAPKFAVRRLQARQAIKNYYEAAKTSRLHKTRGASGSPDTDSRAAQEKLRDQARHLEQNYDMAKGVLDVLVDNVVGLGIIPEAQTKNKEGKLHAEFNKEIMKLWKDWSKKPEVTHELDYYALQRLLARSWLRDGEVFSQILRGNVRGLDHGTQVKLSLEPIESDLVPVTLDDESKGIVQGIKKNQWGRPTAFTVYKSHPGASTFNLTVKTKTIQADSMLHLKTMTRIKQTRGISIFACVMNRFDDIKEIEESERVAARVAAAMTGFIKKGSPDMYIPPSSDEDQREMDLMPGMIYDSLSTGEEVGTIASNRPNNAVIDFRDANIRAAASGLGTGSSSISKNYMGTYSSQRQELVEAHVHYGILWSLFVGLFARPVYEEFVRMAVTSGALAVPSDVDPESLYDADHSRPAMPWIDPAKEMTGIEKEISTKVSSRSSIIRRRGGNPEEIRQQILEEHERDIEDGLKPDPEKMSTDLTDPNDPEDPKEDDEQDDENDPKKDEE